MPSHESPEASVGAAPRRLVDAPHEHFTGPMGEPLGAAGLRASPNAAFQSVAPAPAAPDDLERLFGLAAAQLGGTAPDTDPPPAFRARHGFPPENLSGDPVAPAPPLPPGSASVRKRLRAAGARSFANDCIAEHVTPADLDHMQAEVEGHIARALDALCIDRAADHNTEDTARRVAKLWLREVFAGRYAPAPAATDFPNASGSDALYVVGPVALRSTCSHHFAPILGHAWVGVVPGGRVIGLSKFHRIARWVAARPQIQEEMTVQIADALEAAVKPEGLAVLVRSKHFCCGWRGVLDADTLMTTQEHRGVLRRSDMRERFAALVAQQPAP